MDPRRIRRIHSLGPSLHRLTATAPRAEEVALRTLLVEGVDVDLLVAGVEEVVRLLAALRARLAAQVGLSAAVAQSIVPKTTPSSAANCRIMPQTAAFVRQGQSPRGRGRDARIPSDGLRDAPRASIGRTSPAFYRTNFARAPARQSDGLTFGIPSPAFPRTDFARIRKADANSTISQSRYGRNQPPLNHDSTILRVESKNDFDSTIPHS